MDERRLRKFHIAPDLDCKQGIVCVIELVRFKAFRNSDPAAHGTDDPSLNGNDNRSRILCRNRSRKQFCLPAVFRELPSDDRFQHAFGNLSTVQRVELSLGHKPGVTKLPPKWQHLPLHRWRHKQRFTLITTRLCINKHLVIQ